MGNRREPTAQLAMANKKRRRSESFQAEQGGEDDARKRLEAFHARMFELPQEEAAVAAPETTRVTFKAKKKKHKKHKGMGGDEDDGEPVPMVKFNAKPKKEKKVTTKKKKSAEPVQVKKEKKATGPAVIKVPGMPTVVKSAAIKTTVVTQVVEEKKKKAKKQQNTTVQTVKKTEKVQVAAQAPQWHSMKTGDAQDDDDGVDPLEQALGSMKEMATKQDTKPPRKKQKSVSGKAVAASKTKKQESVKPTELTPVEKQKVAEPAKSMAVEPSKSPKQLQKAEVNGNVDNHPAGTLSKSQKRSLKKKLRKLKLAAVNAKDENAASGTPPQLSEKAGTAFSAGAKPPAPANGSAPSHPAAPSPKPLGSRKKRKKSPKVNGMNSASPKTVAAAKPRQGKPLVLSDEPDSEVAGNAKSTALGMKKAKTESKSKPVTQGATASMKKDIAKEETTATKPTKPLTPIAASLAKDAKKKDDMFMPSREESVKTSAAPKRVVKAAALPVVPLIDDSSDSEEDSGVDSDHSDGASLYSRLIDSAARERWELLEVGRLVRLFAAEWKFKEGKTARFLLDTCPELVSVDFLEGLDINLSAKHLMQVFEAGSGNSGVLMNKMASALENGHLSVRDPSFISALERRVAMMESNTEVMELLHPLMESMSTVRDVGCLLKQLCEHWQLERKISLVQQVLLSNIFDDLDGNQDEILLDLPDLTDRLDFPSRLDQEDVDENGNLKGFLANDDSEVSEVEGSEEELEEDDSEDDDADPYEGETDSEEEDEITGRPRGRNQFIEDEADVGEEDEEEEEEEEHHDDGESSSSDSD